MKKIILHVNTTLNIGGIENFLLNVYKNIDKEKYEFVFCCYRLEKFDYEDELKLLGAKTVRIDDPKKISRKEHLNQLRKIIIKEKIDIIHCHTYFDAAIVALAAKKENIKKIIVHSHTTEGFNKVSYIRKFKWFIAKKMICKNATHFLACSNLAGKSLFLNKKFTIIPNGINVVDFKYDEKTRKIIRNSFGIKDTEIVLGHVGRFEIAKNHKFIIELLMKLKQINTKYKVLFVGDGSLLNEIKNEMNEKKLENDIIFCGAVNNTSQYYNAFDCFVFPSTYEGLGISLIEAQANGLTCLVSNKVPKESKVTETVEYLSLEKIDNWVNFIELANFERNISNNAVINNSEFSINETINLLEKIYDE